jgi:hypothetical protein
VLYQQNSDFSSFKEKTDEKHCLKMTKICENWSKMTKMDPGSNFNVFGTSNLPAFDC